MSLKFLVSVVAAASLVAPAVQAQTPTKSVKIGVLSDMSGGLADAYGPGSAQAAKMAIEDARKDMPDFDIQFVSADHQNKVDVGSTIARQWYDVDKVDAIFDIVNTAVAIAVQGVAKERKKIDVTTTGAASLTGQYCSPWAVHWSTDTNIQVNGVTGGVVSTGGDSWYLITSDYSGTREMASQAGAIVKKMGGKVLGESFVPLGSTDFASAVVSAQGSGAKVIDLSSGGQDTVNAIKQISEFGLTSAGVRIVAPAFFITDAKALGLQVAQGVSFVDSTYWDLDDSTRAFASRFEQTMNKKPTPQQMGAYTAVTHYLKAVKAAGTNDSTAVIAKMKELPINVLNTKDGKVRANGSVVRQRYVFQVKKPSESSGPWDLLKVAKALTLEEGSPVPVEQSGCDFTK